jgi:hypothetical protein
VSVGEPRDVFQKLVGSLVGAGVVTRPEMAVLAFSNRVFALDVQTSPTFAAGQPVEIAWMGGSLTSLPAVRNFDLPPEGKQLLVVLTEPADDRNPTARGQQINVVW